MQWCSPEAPTVSAAEGGARRAGADSRTAMPGHGAEEGLGEARQGRARGPCCRWVCDMGVPSGLGFPTCLL